MIARVILSGQKSINLEAPRAITGLKCIQCGTSLENSRSFKYYNWDYAKSALLKVLQEIDNSRTTR